MTEDPATFIARPELRHLRGGPVLTDADMEQLRKSPWKDLRELAEQHGVRIRGLRTKTETIAALLASPAAPEIVRELQARMGKGPDADRARDQLAATRDSIREASNLGAGVGGAEDAWKKAAQALERGDLAGAREGLDRASRLATEARERRIREIEAALTSVEDHVAAAKKVGADVSDAEALRVQAEAAAATREYVEAGELIKRAERLAMQAQQRQINQAIQLREKQIATAQGVIAACEPLLQEAESYDLDVADVRTLLRQARDVLGKGDYIAGMTFAHIAEEATYRLSSRIDEERRRRGIVRPAAGVCGACGTDHLTFYEDGWGRCSDCGTEFRWRGPMGLRERLRGLLGT